MTLATFIQLVFNSLLLLSTILIYFVIASQFEVNNKSKFGILFLYSLTLFFTIGTGVPIGDGVTIDTSVILLAISTVFIGPIFGGILSFIAFGINIYFQIDMISSIIQVTSIYLLSLIFKYQYKTTEIRDIKKKLFYLTVFGLLISGVVLLSHTPFSTGIPQRGVSLVSRYVLIVYPLITIIVGFIFFILHEFIKQNIHLKYLQFHDERTDLYNSVSFTNETKRIISKQEEKSIILLNINGLKDINDEFGFEVGNSVILDLSNAIKKLFRTSQKYHLNGNDFGIIVDSTDETKIDHCERELIKEVLQRSVNGVRYSISLGSSQIRDKMFYQQAENDMLKNKLLDSNGLKNNIIDTIMEVLFEKDESTRTHSKNVSLYAGMTAEALGLTYREVQEAKLAGMLHDIGKIITPYNILQKPGKLDDEEFAQMKNHVSTGYRILFSSKQLRQISHYVNCHHERLDGRGYPNQLTCDEIPTISKILSIADSYDAMVGIRPYREPMCTESAIKELEKNTDSQFDSEIVSVFINDVIPKIKVPIV